MDDRNSYFLPKKNDGEFLSSFRLKSIAILELLESLLKERILLMDKEKHSSIILLFVPTNCTCK